LQAVLFSGPLQIPATTTLASSQAQAIQSAVKAEAPTARAATLSGWSAELGGLTQKLNQIEKAATGVDPSAPPAGWVEPANFQAARSLLTSLQATLTQAQVAQGQVVLAAQPTGSDVSATVKALQAVGLRFSTPEPKGQATARLLGAAGEGVKTGVASTPAAPSGVSPGIATPDSTARATVQAATQAASATQASAAAAPPVVATVAEAQADQTAKAAPVAQAQAGADVPAEIATTGAPADTAIASAGASPTAPAEAAALQTPQARTPATQLESPAAPRASLAASTGSTTRATDAAGAQAKADSIAQVQSAAAASAATGADPSATLASPLTTTAATQGPSGAATQAPPAAVAFLSSEIVKQASGKTTSFNIELHPADLGKVDVKLQIQSDGQLAARMSFDNPAAAASFQANADSLRHSLQQAGFQVGGDALTFTSGGGQQGAADSGAGGSNGQGGASQNDAGARAFADAQAAATSADPLADPFQARQAIGLDMRI
jgi:flagellar hook-length control protein FliK